MKRLLYLFLIFAFCMNLAGCKKQLDLSTVSEQIEVSLDRAAAQTHGYLSEEICVDGHIIQTNALYFADDNVLYNIYLYQDQLLYGTNLFYNDTLYMRIGDNPWTVVTNKQASIIPPHIAKAPLTQGKIESWKETESGFQVFYSIKLQEGASQGTLKLIEASYDISFDKQWNLVGYSFSETTTDGQATQEVVRSFQIEQMSETEIRSTIDNVWLQVD